MAEKPLNQSSPRRAWEEAKESFHKIWFFLSVQVVAVGAFVLLGTIFTPENAGSLASAIYQVVGGAVGAVVGFGIIYLVMFFLAPYKQRNEARRLIEESRRLALTHKKAPLPNRESLIRVISVIKEKAIDLKMRQDDLNFKEKRRENPREELAKRNNAWFAYLDAKKDLETERLVAGDNFRAVIDKLIMFVDYHVNDCMNIIIAKNKPTTLKTIPFMAQLEDNIEQAIRDLDALSLQEPDKGDYRN